MAVRRFWLSVVVFAAVLASLAAGGCQVVSGVVDFTFAAGGSGGSGGAAPISCKKAADCPLPESPCELPVCVAERCGSVAMSAGTKAADSGQTPGDCAVLVCNGQGTASPQVDDSDVFDDGSDCTEDRCTNGVPVAIPRAFGTSCGEGAAGRCDDAGKCLECLSDADCGLPSECGTPHCKAGACDVDAVAAGTPASVQSVGDCHKRVCDGKGKVADEIDDTDLPDDGLDCTDDVCTAGAASNPARLSGTGCGNKAGMTCDGMGQCTGCAVAADCSGSDTACRSRACNAGVCAIAKQPENTKLPAGSQVSGDCKAKVCNALGIVTEVPDEDLPADDGNACTSVACVDGTPQHPPASQGSPCAVDGGTLCDGSGSCVVCNAGADCAGDPGVCKVKACVNHACSVLNAAADIPAAAATQTDGDCRLVVCDGKGGTVTKPLDVDVPVDGIACTQDVCTSGTPSNPFEDVGAACQSALGGKFCDGKGGCVQCLADADCNGGHCVKGSCDNCQAKSCLSLGLSCGQTTDGCGVDLICDDLNRNGLETDVDCGGDKASCPRRCVVGKQCLADGDCASGHCEQGFCCNVACDGLCRSCAAADTGGTDGLCSFIPKGGDPLGQCGSGNVCDGTGGCKKQLGQTCSTASQCVSGICSAQDGVCCDASCVGACQACTFAKTGELDGSCAPVLADTDPDNECAEQAASTCGRTGACDGAPQPACKLHPATTECKAGTCNAMTASQTSASQCNGKGSCIAGMTSSCNGFACDASACKTTCASDADCLATHFCGVGGTCMAKGAQGATCTADNQCGNGLCRDGYCCNTACTGLCNSCAAVNTGLANGTCGSTLLALDPDNECSGATPFCSGKNMCVACGSTAVAPGGVCPAACTGGCDAGTRTCRIACNTEDLICADATVTCPAGWNCSVLCGKKGGCKSATINCPSSYACSITCDGESEACAGGTINCKNGNCNLSCKGAQGKKACTGTTMECGPNKCSATCESTFAAALPTVKGNASCACTACGLGACL